MKKNTTLIIATALITTTALMQGMEREKQISITRSPEEKDLKMITMHYSGPSIMTALYTKYQNGAQFVGTTCCLVSNFESDFNKECAKVKELCHQATHQNNASNITALMFWCFDPNLPDTHAIYLNRKKLTDLYLVVKKHFMNEYEASLRNNGKRVRKYEVQSWLTSLIRTRTTDFDVLKNTDEKAKLEVTLYPNEGYIAINGNRFKL